MEFELQYELDEFKLIQDQYFDEDGKCYSRHILSTDIAEKMLNLIDNLSERVNALEPVIKQQIKKSLPIHGVVKSFYCGEQEEGRQICDSQCMGCDGLERKGS
jgi:hypothetical protein